MFRSRNINAPSGQYIVFPLGNWQNSINMKLPNFDKGVIKNTLYLSFHYA